MTKMMSFINYIYVLLVLYMCAVISDCEDCERDKSRVVRNVVKNELLSLYKSVGTKVPYKCPFFKDRDKYIVQEEHKEKEASTYWTCMYCGKSFIGEIYLDMHFSNRHQDSIYKMNDSVCLADYCELFRCDVLSGLAKPTFWDVALCMEEDMRDLSSDCVELMKTCIPDNLNWNTSKALLASLSQSVCSYLQCKTYYDAPSIEEKEPPSTSYVVGSVMLLICMLLYYCVAVNYFWLDTFSEAYDSDDKTAHQPSSLFDSEEKEKLNKVHSTRPHPRKKKNFIQAEAAANQDIFKVRSGFNAKESSTHKAVLQARAELNAPEFRRNQQDSFQAHSALNSSVQDIEETG